MVLTYLNLASSIVCQKQSNGDASQGVLYTALIGFELKMLVGRKGELYIYIYVGLSALLVSTDRAMRRPTNRGTGNSVAPRLFVYMRQLLLISLLGVGKAQTKTHETF